MMNIKEKIGLLLLTIVILINITVAARFYNISEISLTNFFYYQGRTNELFDPSVRY